MIWKYIPIKIHEKKYIFYINFKLVLIKFEGKYNKKNTKKKYKKNKKKIKS